MSKYFGNDSKVLNVAANCWEQIHDRVGDAIKVCLCARLLWLSQVEE